MIFRLFLSFLKIGAVSFGGGYGMISLLRETVLQNNWLSEEQFLSFIAVAESTPGPLAVNMATFVGSETGGFWGALAATAGVVLPAFLLILLIAALLKNLLNYPSVQGILRGVRPCVVALILSTGCTMGLSLLLGLEKSNGFAPDVRAIVLLVLLFLVHLIFRKRHKSPPPILMILLSALSGMVAYGILG